MTTRLLMCSVMALGAAQAAPPASLGPDWEEECAGPGDDAGSLPGDAQATMGGGTLNSICGSLNIAAEGIDFEDMYVIRVCAPMAFRASTAFVHGGSSDFDTQLWLFSPAGNPNLALGLLANDDAPSGQTIRSVILPASNDGSGAALTMPGLYLLAISGKDNDSVSPGGLIFDVPMGSETEISGPDGPGGPMPVSGWQFPHPPATGNYIIDLRGVAFAFGPSMDCNCNGVYDNCDIANGTSLDNDGNGIPDECEGDCPADLDGSGIVDVTDLLAVLAAWGTPGGDATGDCMTDVSDLLAVLAAWGPC